MARCWDSQLLINSEYSHFLIWNWRASFLTIMRCLLIFYVSGGNLDLPDDCQLPWSLIVSKTALLTAHTPRCRTLCVTFTCCCLEARARPSQASGSSSDGSTSHLLAIKWATRWYVSLKPVHLWCTILSLLYRVYIIVPVWCRCSCGRQSASVFRPSSTRKSCGESSRCSAASGPSWRGSTLLTWGQPPLSSRWDVVVGRRGSAVLHSLHSLGSLS